MTRPSARTPKDGTPLVKLIEKCRLAAGHPRSTKAQNRCRLAPAKSSPKAWTALRERLVELPHALGAKFAKWRRR